MIINKIYAYVAGAALALVLGLLGVQTLRLHKAKLEIASVKTTLATERGLWSEERAKAASILATAQAKLREVEGDLQNFAANNRKVTNDQIRVLTARNDSLLGRVRNAERAALASDMSGAASAADAGEAAGGDAGKELLGWLGEEDVREAGRADVIRLHLQACYARYDRAQAALEALNKGDEKGSGQ